MSTNSAGNEMLVAALSGTVGGVTSKLTTYPLETIKTCLANKARHEKSLDVICQLLPLGIYRGIRLRLLRSVISNFAFFYLMEGVARLVKSAVRKMSHMRTLPAVEFLLAGFCGDALCVPVLAPLDYVLSQVQTSKTSEGMVSVVRRVLKEGGAAALYTGWPIYVIASLRPAVKYALFEPVKKMLLRGRSRTAVLSTAQAFWLGAATNALASTLFYPINAARIVIMSRRKGKDSEDKEVSNNVFSVMASIHREEGFGGLYKGLSSELAEGTLGSAIQLAIKERSTKGVRALVSKA